MIKLALVILVTFLTASPSSSYMSEMSKNNTLNTIYQSIRLVPNNSVEATSFDKVGIIPFEWKLDRTSSASVPFPFNFESGLKFLPLYKPGDEKPIFIPTEWNNKQIWLWWKNIKK